MPSGFGHSPRWQARFQLSRPVLHNDDTRRHVVSFDHQEPSIRANVVKRIEIRAADGREAALEQLSRLADGQTRPLRAHADGEHIVIIYGVVAVTSATMTRARRARGVAARVRLYFRMTARPTRRGVGGPLLSASAVMPTVQK